VQRYYFDHNATTPVSKEVLNLYTALLRENFGNASSIHWFGQEARTRLERAREQVARMLAADPKEIFFTSGGTESNNHGVLGPVRYVGVTGRHIITTQIEHPAVMRAVGQLEREGATATYLPVGGSGAVDPDDVRRALRPETALIAIMHVNNETGVIQPVQEIAAIAKEAAVPFHVDGVQAPGRLPLDPSGPPGDYYAISGHKLYAPKGIGALYVRNGAPFESALYGGPQERQRRPGTQNVPAAAALGEAAQWVRKHAREEIARLAALRDRLEQSILDRIPGSAVNGTGPRVANTTNIRFDGIGGEALLIALDLKGFAVATGAACSSGATEASHVLRAMGLTREQARSSIRFSLGRANDAAQVDALVEAVVAAVEHLRKVAPARR